MNEFKWRTPDEANQHLLLGSWERVLIINDEGQKMTVPATKCLDWAAKGKIKCWSYIPDYK